VQINGQKRAISLKSWILSHANVTNTLKKNDMAHLGFTDLQIGRDCVTDRSEFTRRSYFCRVRSGAHGEGQVFPLDPLQLK
jgi:hypothetical protein